MANSVTTHAWADVRLISGLKTIPEKFVGWLFTIAENHPSYKEMQYLSSLSDAQLAKRGIRREEIALHAFRGRLFG